MLHLVIFFLWWFVALLAVATGGNVPDGDTFFAMLLPLLLWSLIYRERIVEATGVASLLRSLEGRMNYGNVGFHCILISTLFAGPLALTLYWEERERKAERSGARRAVHA